MARGRHEASEIDGVGITAGAGLATAMPAFVPLDFRGAGSFHSPNDERCMI